MFLADENARGIANASGSNGEEEAMETCKSCQQVVDPQARICACGVPTVRASFKERAEYEVKQWRAYKSRSQESA